MPVLFVKSLSKDEMKDLKRLKVELDAETWKDFILTLSKFKLSILPISDEKPPMSKRWELATRLSTSLATFYCDAIKKHLDLEEYHKLQREIWGEIGRMAGEALKGYLKGDLEDARKAHEAMRMISKVIVGPELEYEFVEGSWEKSVMRVTQCPWRSRMMETGIQSFCEPYHEAHEALCQAILGSMGSKYRFHFTDRTASQNFPYCEEVVEFLD